MATEWSVPRIWNGQLAAVLATGKSLSVDDIDAIRKVGMRMIAVNDAYRLVPDADVLYAADEQWWHHHGPRGALDFKGTLVTMSRTCQYPQVKLLLSGDVTGFDKRPTHMTTCGNSGWQGIHLAAHYGATRILLLGFDFKGDHFFGKHPPPLHRPTDFRRYARWMELSVPAITKRGIEIVNCNVDSGLTCFKRMRLKDALTSMCPDSRDAAIPEGCLQVGA